MDELVGVVEAARRLGINPSTLWRWTDRGLVTPSAHLLGGHRRRGRLLFTEARVEEIRALMQTYSATGVETR